MVIFLFTFQLQYSLLHKEESAHDESIWSCSWGRVAVSADDDQDKELDADADNSRDSFGNKKSSQEYRDFVVTGGLDDRVKVWDVTKESKLKLRNTFTGHSLGVVSVDVSSNGEGKTSSKTIPY